MINDSKPKVPSGSDVMFDRMAAWRGSLDELGKSISIQRDQPAPSAEAEPAEETADDIQSQADEPPPTTIETPTLAPVEAIEPDQSSPPPAPTIPVETPLLAEASAIVDPPEDTPPPSPGVSMEQPTLEEAGRLLQQISRLEHEAHILRLILGERNLSAHEHRLLADVNAEITALHQHWRSDNPLHS